MTTSTPRNPTAEAAKLTQDAVNAELRHLSGIAPPLEAVPFIPAVGDLVRDPHGFAARVCRYFYAEDGEEGGRTVLAVELEDDGFRYVTAASALSPLAEGGPPDDDDGDENGDDDDLGGEGAFDALHDAPIPYESTDAALALEAVALACEEALERSEHDPDVTTRDEALLMLADARNRFVELRSLCAAAGVIECGEEF